MALVPPRRPGALLLVALGVSLALGTARADPSPKPMDTPTITDEDRAAFTRYLKKVLPKNSPMRKPGISRMQLNRTDYLDHGTPLRFFEPWVLVPVTYWDPAAGAPGRVLEDLRILWNPKTGRFRQSSLAWTEAFRKKHPLEVRAMSDEDIAYYLMELVHLVPRADRWGFRIESLSRRRPQGLDFEVAYAEPREMNTFGDGPTKTLIRLGPDGAVATFKFLQRELPKDP